MSAKKHIIKLESVESTNSYIMEHSSQMFHATVVSTYNQTSGRGQRGNSWESEPYKNLTFSLFITPQNILARQQFYISEIVSIAIVSVLRRYILNQSVTIKWPNDIYVNDSKICGILIENTISGQSIYRSIIGIGINVNQRDFKSDAPNPISLIHFINKEISLDTILEEVTNEIFHTFEHYDTSCEFEQLHRLYLSMLWRNDNKPHLYTTPCGNIFNATITDVAPNGLLTLTDTKGDSQSYAFKEIAAII